MKSMSHHFCTSNIALDGFFYFSGIVATFRICDPISSATEYSSNFLLGCITYYTSAGRFIHFKVRMTKAPLNVTFGVELEIALAFLPSEQADPLMEWRLEELESEDDIDKLRQAENVLRNSVIRVLREAGLEANDCNDLNYEKDEHYYTKWSVAEENSIKIDDAQKKNLSYWANSSPLALSSEQRAELRFLDIEVVSRVLKFDANGLKEIETAISAIISTLPVILPSNTGLHVHVGNQFSGLPTETLDNILAMVSCMEDQFNQLHPPHRLRGHHIILPRFSFHNANHGDSLRMAEFVYRQNDLKDFLHYFGWHKSVCYNFKNLNPRAKKKTVEFRQHMCTLDIEEIKQWIILVCNLINIAYQSETGIFIDILRRHAYDSDYSIIDLLEDLGLFGSAHYYSTRIHEHPYDTRIFNPETENVSWLGWHTPEFRDKYRWRSGPVISKSNEKEAPNKSTTQGSGMSMGWSLDDSLGGPEESSEEDTLGDSEESSDESAE